jgi:hypothetical protein
MHSTARMLGIQPAKTDLEDFFITEGFSIYITPLCMMIWSAIE